MTTICHGHLVQEKKNKHLDLFSLSQKAALHNHAVVMQL